MTKNISNIFIENINSDLNLDQSITNDIEEWRDADDFPGCKISSLGKLMLPSGKISKVSAKSSGYVQATIREGKITKCKLMHILVAKAFIANPENKP